MAAGTSAPNPLGAGAPGLGAMMPADTMSSTPTLSSPMPASLPNPPAMTGAAGSAGGPSISPLALTLASLGGGAVGPRAGMAAVMPVSQQVAAMGMPQGTGGGLSVSDLASLLVGGDV